MLQGQVQPHRLGIHLAAAGVGKCVPRCAPLGQPPLDIHPQRQARRMQPDTLQPPSQIGNRRLVRHRREIIAARMARLRRVLTQDPAHLIQLLGLRIVRLKRVIADRPTLRPATHMAQRPKILGPIPDQHRAIQLGIAARDIVIARVERLALAVQPVLIRAKMPITEDRQSIARFGRILHPPATFQYHNPPPRGCQGRGQRGTAHPRADDDDIGLHLNSPEILVCAWHETPPHPRPCPPSPPSCPSPGPRSSRHGPRRPQHGSCISQPRSHAAK